MTGVAGTLAGVLVLGGLFACHPPGPTDSRSPATATQAGHRATGARNQAETCPQPEPGERVKWRHGGSAATATLVGDSHHSANDPIINPGQDAVIKGKFAYGTISKDLQDEQISLWLRMAPCGPWRNVAQGLTDSDGRLDIPVRRDLVPSPGAYPFQLIVRGDLTRAHGTIYVLPRNTQVVIFDVDGTLTTGDDEVVMQITFGSDPEVRPGASAVVSRWVEAGYLPVYITGRPYPLRGSTASWLYRYQFPPGPLITTDLFGQSVPGEGGVGQFKSAILGGLRDDAGLDIVAAYGNASTDVCAYSEAGIDPSQTFIVGSGTPRCQDHPPVEPMPSYIDHLETMAIEKAAR